MNSDKIHRKPSNCVLLKRTHSPNLCWLLEKCILGQIQVQICPKERNFFSNFFAYYIDFIRTFNFLWPSIKEWILPFLLQNFFLQFSFVLPKEVRLILSNKSASPSNAFTSF